MNLVDAAFVRTASSTTISRTICGLGTHTTTPMEPAIGMTVQKSGRTTRVTQGEIVNTNATVTYTLSCGTARFLNQILVRPIGGCPPFSNQGDSGAPVVDESLNPVGMVVADNGCVSPRTTVNPIQAILDAFGASLY